MRRLHALLATCAILAVSCAEAAADETTTTTVATTSTEAPATTTSQPDSATTTTPETTTTVDRTVGPEGSGCAPGTDDLGDGNWYGEVPELDDDGIRFDLACWFRGEAAAVAAAEDGEESPPPNDYYVRNQSEQLRELAVDPGTPVLWYLSGDPNDSRDGTFSEWAEFIKGIEPEYRLGIWVTIEDGAVAEIEEQWVP